MTSASSHPAMRSANLRCQNVHQDFPNGFLPEGKYDAGIVRRVLRHTVGRRLYFLIGRTSWEMR